jgi:hypothetical protein
MAMDAATAQDIYRRLSRSRQGALVEQLVRVAVRYARLRTDWQLAPVEERQEMDAARTRAHDTFIDACNILSRAVQKAGEDNGWRAEIGAAGDPHDRKAIGDLACHLHCVLGLLAR